MDSRFTQCETRRYLKIWHEVVSNGCRPRKCTSTAQSRVHVWLYKAQVQGDEEAKQGIEFIMQAMRETRASQQTNDSSIPPPSASPVPIGTRVELHGIKAKPQLNGQYGIVVGYVASSGRCTVVLEGARGETETKMSIKPENLTWK